jgi:hypothetical protein
VTAVAWFLSELGFPLAYGAALALALDIARRGPVRVRHYRWRNRRWLRTQVRAIELRSRADAVRGGSEEEAGGCLPRSLPAPAGGEQRTPGPVSVALPPAPSTSQRTPINSQSGSSQPLAGAVVPPNTAPVRPPLVRIGGAW